jgi:hypothetical protein
MKRKPSSCRQCTRNQRAIRDLEQRLLLLEEEINGPPAEELLAQFEAQGREHAARWAAQQEYWKLQHEEFRDKFPWLREAAEKERARYEAFMKGRGFEP